MIRGRCLSEDGRSLPPERMEMVDKSGKVAAPAIFHAHQFGRRRSAPGDAAPRGSSEEDLTAGRVRVYCIRAPGPAEAGRHGRTRNGAWGGTRGASLREKHESE